MFCVVWDYSNSKLKDKQYKENTYRIALKLNSKFSLILGQRNRVIKESAQRSVK